MGLFTYEGFGIEKNKDKTIFEDAQRIASRKEQSRLNDKESVQKNNVSILDFNFNKAKEEASRMRKEDYIQKVNAMKEQRGKGKVTRFIDEAKSEFKGRLGKSKGFRISPRGGFRL